MTNKNRIVTVKIFYIIVSVITILLGILFIACPQISLNIICRISGIIMMTCGAVKLTGYFSKDLYRLAFEHGLIFGTLLCVIGLCAIIHPVKIISAVHISAGIIFIEESIFRLRTSIDAKRFGLKKWYIITILAVITLIAGLLLLLRPFDVAKKMMVVLGLAMIADGILNLCVAVYAIKVTKKQFVDIEYYTEERKD